MRSTIILFFFNIIIAQHIDIVGDSITKSGYPEVANAWMIRNGIGLTITNYGVNGRGVVNNEYTETSQYEEVICRQAQYIVIMLGINDATWFKDASQDDKDKFKIKYKNLVKTFQVHSKVILSTSTHKAEGNSAFNQAVDEINQIIIEICNEYSLQIIDLDSVLGRDPTIFWPDKIHPKDAGIKLLGVGLFEATKNLPIGSRDVQSGCKPENPTSDNIINFQWEQVGPDIKFLWDVVEDATNYKISKYWVDDGDEYYWMDDNILDTQYLDSNFIINQDYSCGIKAYKNSELIGESKKITVRLRQTIILEVEDEYWDAVDDYEEQKKIGWFGCNY